MRLLLDTHTLIWWFLDRDELSRRAHDAIEAATDPVFVSAVSAHEISTKHRNGKLPQVARLLHDFERLIATQDFTQLPLSVAHGRRSGAMRGLHKDPFDRMLAAQCLMDDLTFVSNDAAVDQFGVTRLW